MTVGALCGCCYFIVSCTDCMLSSNSAIPTLSLETKIVWRIGEVGVILSHHAVGQC